ncbi:MAG: Ig-like domain-containing protein, partial [Anaerolineales bacterium]|nr:Ig-like domain-containing protein [Anaerolineales bacterium]
KTNGSNGTVICTTTQCEYTPGGGFTGIDTYTYTITDNNSNTDTATVTITVTPCAAPGGSGFVSSYDPIDTQTGVPVAVSPKIYFNQDMDYASLDQYDKFHVALCGNGGCGQIVSPVAIIISSTTYANDTVTLNPNVDLNPSMTYYIMAGTQIENACNTAQGSFETAEFTTAP